MTIVNGISDEVRMLANLDSSKFKFHLTGSRFFGGITASSDWDFFVQDTEEVRFYLVELGFEVYSSSYSDDPQNAIVFRHLKLKFDIQCVENVELKLHVQHMIDKHHLFFGLEMNKSSKNIQRRIWKALYEAYTLGFEFVKS